ncbi:pyridoxal phosphate-dependent aminotransferase family protein [Paenibacillus sp. YPG26]|uniref:aminotransferase class I/II-fold pyridoxal phosphate-dependent enzyme n=1 Tax=Paenibacillus sp. YPG26 TaxID=2878915 RepID=UPI00203C6E2A|nr:pyridoxal phosphate-dependent aminotransferase family protein [Paenibacillus sp. YPG26]USB33661.1 pyridoxal phosphate-dependent aminotransferase family protein [Paenibacillus sp. YPG26]
MDVFQKCLDWDFVKNLRANQSYPYFQALHEKNGTFIATEEHEMIMLGSNDYLGLSNNPRVMLAAHEATTRFGTSSSGSRFLNGTLALHNELEQRLARFLNKEKAIVFSTGYQTNLGSISALLGRNDVAIIDRGVHASIIDGIKLGVGKMVRFRHNDMEDLEAKLQAVPEQAGKLIIVDGVFSMEGDMANLKDIVYLKNKYSARLLVDDAHGIGVLGEQGRGTCEHFGVEDETDLIAGTFSKSFGSLGGFIAGNEDVIDYIQHKARSMIFSASMTPASVAAALTSLDIMETEQVWRSNLLTNMNKFSGALRGMGFDIGESNTPIIPILIGDTVTTFKFWSLLQQNGIYTNPIISPAVQEGNELIRTSVMATHTDEQLSHAINVFEQIGRSLDIIQPILVDK